MAVQERTVQTTLTTDTIEYRSEKGASTRSWEVFATNARGNFVIRI